MYRRILVATDGSENAGKAVETAAKLASLARSERLDIVHVVQHPATMMAAAEGSAYMMMESLFEELRTEGARILEQAANTAREFFDGTIETHQLTGPVAERIVSLIEEKQHDLVVVGRRGLNRLERLFIGSVSGRLASQARCSVLVVKD